MDTEQPLFVDKEKRSPKEFVEIMRRRKERHQLAMAATWHDGVKALLTKEERRIPTRGTEEAARAYFCG